MNELQEKLFELLIEIDEICDKYNITYYLAAGGALGAIRNGGFLPWDDDLDIYITRKNWEKLKLAMSKELKADRSFIHNENTKYYFNPVGRYINKNDTMILKSQFLCGECCGVMIDLLIFDPMPISKTENLIHRKYMKVYTELLSPYLVFNKTLNINNRDFDYQLYKKYYRLSKLFGKRRILNFLKRKLTDVSEFSCEKYCMCWGSKTFIYDKELFGGTRKVYFEGRKFRVMEFTEKVFRIGYGDNWMYVPENNKKNKHNFLMDLNTPFKKHIDSYKSTAACTKKTLRFYERKKKYTLKAIKARTNYEVEESKLIIDLLTKKLNMKCNLSKLRKAIMSDDLTYIDEVVNSYLEIQLREQVLKYGLAIPVEDEFIYLITNYLISKGRYYDADKIISITEKQRDLTYKLTYIKNLISLCRKFSVAIYDENNEVEVNNLLKNNIKYKDILLDYSLAELWLMKKNAKTQKDYSDIIKKTKIVSDKYSDNGELIAYEAFSLFKLGNINSAREKYVEAINKTRNAFVWKEAKELVDVDAYLL